MGQGTNTEYRHLVVHARSGSLPETLIYLPDEGNFSWVPGSDWIQLAMRHLENNFC